MLLVSRTLVRHLAGASSSAPPSPLALVSEPGHLVAILPPVASDDDEKPLPDVDRPRLFGWQILPTGVPVPPPGVPLPGPGDDDDEPGLLGKVRSSDMAGQFLLLLVPSLGAAIVSSFAFFPGLW